MVRGTIFDVKRFAIHDGPGVRTTVFFKGCPLHCVLCHNPESQRSRPEVLLYEDRCIADGAPCVRVCSEGALSVNEHIVRDGNCRDCTRCATVCVSGALELAGRRVSVGELMDELRRDVVFFDESGGGVTFSGGEPLAQPEFLAALASACRTEEIHTALDTSGFASAATLTQIAPLIDLFLFDLKVMESGRHEAFTGVPNAEILDNIRRLAQARRDVVIRVPLFPGINDDADNIDRLGAFVGGLPAPYPIDLLPYHRTAIDKYERLGREYPMPEVSPPGPDAVASVVAILRSQGLYVLVRGNEPDGSGTAFDDEIAETTSDETVAPFPAEAATAERARRLANER